MKGYLYTIVNIINGKEYIGKTYDSIDSRFKGHISKSKIETHRPLYRAFNKYGIDKFKLYLLGEYPEGVLEQKEIEAINLYETYKNGYNATLGGDGTRYINTTEILEYYNKHCKVLGQISRHLKVDIKTIRGVLLANGIKLQTHKEIMSLHLFSPEKVRIVELNKIFNNAMECADYLIDSGISNVSQRRTKESIYRVCKGLRKTYLRYHFEYYNADMM